MYVVAFDSVSGLYASFLIPKCIPTTPEEEEQKTADGRVKRRTREASPKKMAKEVKNKSKFDV